MIVKGTKQLGSFKRGINIYIPKKQIVIPPAPSGIPVASTNAVNVTISGYGTITFTKGTFTNVGNVVSGTAYIDNSAWFTLLSPNTIINFCYGPFNVAPNQWRISQWEDYGDCSPTELFLISTISSTDTNYIPTIGWSPAITITAA